MKKAKVVFVLWLLFIALTIIWQVVKDKDVLNGVPGDVAWNPEAHCTESGTQAFYLRPNPNGTVRKYLEVGLRGRFGEEGGEVHRKFFTVSYEPVEVLSENDFGFNVRFCSDGSEGLFNKEWIDFKR